jgi:hypothetical protein
MRENGLAKLSGTTRLHFPRWRCGGDIDVNECEKAGIKVKPGLDVPVQESLM